MLATVYEGRDVVDLSRRMSVLDWRRLVLPRLRTAETCGLGRRSWREVCPRWVVDRLDGVRRELEADLSYSYEEVLDCRAELVLVLAEGRGVLVGDDIHRTRFKFIATKTGRFGVEAGWWNPMTLAEADRRRVRARPGRRLASLDFVAMDLCSMLVLEPSLRRIYEGADDLHLRTTELLGYGPTMRDEVKEQTFVYAYGGRSRFNYLFEAKVPEMTRLRGRPGIPLLVQERSATTFRWALGSVLEEFVQRATDPLFPVYDELVVEYSNIDAVKVIAWTMEEAATRLTGVSHRVRVRIGETYDECK